MIGSCYELLAFFLIYSFLGWCAEVAYAALKSGKIVNRGFLNGPVCPIYGVGMLGVLLMAGPFSDRLMLLFLVGIVFCSLIELVGGWTLEKFFHTRWWDYSKDPFNLGGYICLGFSILWGLAVVFVVRLIHPVIALSMHLIPHILGIVLLSLFSAVFVTDLVLTLITLIGLRRRLGELERIAGALHSVGDSLSDRVGSSALAADQRLSPIVESGKEHLDTAVESGKERLDAARGALEDARERLDTAMETGKERLDTAVDAAKESGLAHISEAKETLEDVREKGKEKISEQREKLDAHMDEALAEMRARRKKLEQRMQELRGMGPIARYYSRRLNSAYPALRQEMRKRMEALEGKIKSADRSEK